MDHYEGFPPQFFYRTDAAPDREFYRPPQLVTYLDAGHGHRNGHPLPLPRNGDPQPMDSNTDQHRSLTHRHGLVLSRMLRNGHVRFGGRAEETDQAKGRHRASTRPNTYVKIAGR